MPESRLYGLAKDSPKRKSRGRGRMRRRLYRRNLTPKQKAAQLAAIKEERNQDRLFNKMINSISSYLLSKKVNIRCKRYFGLY